jgi:hypothetical protein
MSCILWVLGSSIEEIFDLLSDLLISKDLEWSSLVLFKNF